MIQNKTKNRETKRVKKGIPVWSSVYHILLCNFGNLEYFHDFLLGQTLTFVIDVFIFFYLLLSNLISYSFKPSSPLSLFFYCTQFLLLFSRSLSCPCPCLLLVLCLFFTVSLLLNYCSVRYCTAPRMSMTRVRVGIACQTAISLL